MSLPEQSDWNNLFFKIGGNVWESNPPKRLLTPYTGFEDQRAHQNSSTPMLKDCKPEKRVSQDRARFFFKPTQPANSTDDPPVLKLNRQTSNTQKRNFVFVKTTTKKGWK